jgi:bacterioferritin (cytochrome b1)
MTRTDFPTTAGVDAAEATEFVVDRLNDALAAELLCMMRANLGQPPAQEPALQGEPDSDFQELVQTRRSLERAHRITARILELGGEVIFEPQALFALSAPEWGSLSGLVSILSGFADTGADGDARLRVQIDRIGDADACSRRLLEDIVRDRAAEELEAMPRTAMPH